MPTSSDSERPECGEVTALERALGVLFQLDEQILGNVPTADKNLIKVQGALLLIPMTVGGVGMFVTVLTIASTWISALAGVFWAACLGMFDASFISVSFRSTSWIGLVVRLGAAVVFSMVVATTLELAVLDGAIRNELAAQRYEQETALRAELEAALPDLIARDPMLESARIALARARANVEKVRTEVDRARDTQRSLDDRWMNENERGGCETICIPLKLAADAHRDGPLARSEKASKDASVHVSTLRQEYEGTLSEVTEREHARVHREATALGHLSASQNQGVLTRLETLHSLMARETTVLVIVLVIKLFFLLIELLPLLIKLTNRSSIRTHMTSLLDEEERVARELWNKRSAVSLDSRLRRLRARASLEQFSAFLALNDRLSENYSHGIDLEEQERLTGHVQSRLRGIFDLPD